jgi:hypothetical protein
MGFPSNTAPNMTLINPPSYLSLPGRAMVALTTDPAEIWTRAVEKFSERREWQRPKCNYEPVPAWDRQLHGLLALNWPCPVCAEFGDIWARIIDQLTASGLRVGPQSFGPWNDGDAGLVRAIWCLARHLRPEHVVETGVAHGLTSRFILEALTQNGVGDLSSIDLPPLDRDLHRQVGIAVGPGFSDRWTYIRGSSRRRLPSLLSRLSQIDLFVHDSLHSERNVRFELDRAWAVLRPGGALVIDDIDANWGFHSFNQAFPGTPHLVCESEPLTPDHRRFNGKGLFGIVLKPSDRRLPSA